MLFHSFFLKPLFPHIPELLFSGIQSSGWDTHQSIKCKSLEVSPSVTPGLHQWPLRGWTSEPAEGREPPVFRNSSPKSCCLSSTEPPVCQHSPAAHGAARVTFLPKTSGYRNAVFLQERDRTAVSTQSSLPRYTGRLFIARANLEVVFCFHFWFVFFVLFGGQLFISVALKICVPPKPVCSCPHSTRGWDSSCSNNTSSTDATEFQQRMERKQKLAVAAASAVAQGRENLQEQKVPALSHSPTQAKGGREREIFPCQVSRYKWLF